jgi:hypothetical protein
MAERLHVEAKSPIRQDKSDRGTVFYQDFLITDLHGVENAADRRDDTPLSIYFWVEVIELDAMSLLEWHCFLPSSRLSLPPGDSQLVTLSFDVPDQAAPGIYPYTIVVKCEQMLEETVRVPLELAIAPPEVAVTQSEVRFKPIPGFMIDPPTTETKPQTLQSGQTTTFKITVENRSSMSDRFYLTCPVLSRDWYTLKYIDYGDRFRDVVQRPDGLQLNPHERGEILLTFHPPQETLAGDYCFPFQLLSMNHPDLGMVDEIYLQLLPDSHLGIQLDPVAHVITNHPKVFTLTLVNRGNIYRKFKLDVQDAGNLFTFATDVPGNLIEVAPKTVATLLIEVKPRRKWQRPWGRKPRKVLVSFNLIATESNPMLTAPISPQARLVWQPRPWWVRLALLLFGTSAIAGLFLTILYRFNRQPSPPLQITMFKPSANRLGSSGLVRLDWQVINPGNLDRVVLSRVEEGAETASQTYDFKSSIPAKLRAKTPQNAGCRSKVSRPTSSTSSFTLWRLPLPPIPIFSSLQHAPEAVTTIDCRGISIATPHSGQYRFKLKLFSKSDPKIPVTDQTTDAVTVPGKPLSQSTPDTGLDIASEPDSTANLNSTASIQPPQITSFTVNGKPAKSQPTQVHSANQNQRSVGVVISWQVSGDNLTVQLLPSPGYVSTEGSVQSSLKTGSVQTFTLIAKNQLGEQAMQSVVVRASGSGQVPRSSPSPTLPLPTLSPSGVEGDINTHSIENNNNNEGTPDSTGAPTNSSTPESIDGNGNSSPAPISPEPSPTH